MTEQDNPYNNVVEAIYDMIAGSMVQNFEIGEVVSPYPLAIRIGELILEREDMMFDKRLLNQAGETHPGIDYRDADFSDGDKVLIMMSNDQQNLIVVCKLQ